MVTTKQRSRAKTQNIKKKGGGTEQIIIENHQPKKVYRNTHTKETMEIKTARKQRQNGSNKYSYINNHLNVNELNSPIKRHRVAGWMTKYDPAICCLQETQRQRQT